MVGKAGLVLDHEPVQLRLAAEYRVHPGLGADRAPPRYVGVPVPPPICFAPTRHSVTISPIPLAGHDVCPRPPAFTPARVLHHQTMDIPSYEPAAALDFFKAGGEVETIPAGRTIFREDRRSRRALFEPQDVPPAQGPGQPDRGGAGNPRGEGGRNLRRDGGARPHAAQRHRRGEDALPGDRAGCRSSFARRSPRSPRSRSFS